jgi:peptide/nickel transport system substrate-binding protein
VRIRKAMYHAINIDTFIEKFSNTSATVPVSQFVNPYLFGYNPNIERLPYDKEKATQLMRDAGYANGFTIELDCPDSNRSIDLCKEIAHQLAEINITVKINPIPGFEYYSELYYKNTSFYITGINTLTAEGTIKLLIHTSDMNENIGIWNYGNYSNPEVDRLYEIICYTMEPEIRKELIQQVFAIAMDEVAWIPLYSSKAFYGICADFEWSPRPSLYMIFEEISLSR